MPGVSVLRLRVEQLSFGRCHSAVDIALAVHPEDEVAMCPGACTSAGCAVASPLGVLVGRAFLNRQSLNCHQLFFHERNEIGPPAAAHPAAAQPTSPGVVPAPAAAAVAAVPMAHPPIEQTPLTAAPSAAFTISGIHAASVVGLPSGIPVPPPPHPMPSEAQAMSSRPPEAPQPYTPSPQAAYALGPPPAPGAAPRPSGSLAAVFGAEEADGLDELL